MSNQKLDQIKTAGFILKPNDPDIKGLYERIKGQFEARGISVLLAACMLPRRWFRFFTNWKKHMQKHAGIPPSPKNTKAFCMSIMAVPRHYILRGALPECSVARGST